MSVTRHASGGELVRRGDSVAAGARSLMDKPQPLGFLPTWWFWRELYREQRFRTLMALLTLPAWGLILVWWTYVGTSFLIPVLLLYVAEGIVEKFVRREIVRRRKRASLGRPSPQLGTALQDEQPTMGAD